MFFISSRPQCVKILLELTENYWCNHSAFHTVRSVDVCQYNNIPLNLYYKTYQIPKLKCFSSGLVVCFAKSTDARYLVENEDVATSE